MVNIAIDLSPDEEELLVKTLREYKDVFAWSYKDLKGVDASICQHTIPMRDDAKPSKQRPYMYIGIKSKKKLISYWRQSSFTKLSTRNGYHLLWLFPKRTANSECVSISRK